VTNRVTDMYTRWTKVWNREMISNVDREIWVTLKFYLLDDYINKLQ
jgi:hypothetical protein